MTSFGAQFSNPSNGKLQASTNEVLYQLRKTGSGTTVANTGTSTNPSYLPVPGSMANPDTLTALSLDGGYGAALASGYGGQKVYASNAPVGTTFRYYLFERADRTAPTGYGVIFKNSGTGAVGWSSQYFTMSGVAMLGSPTTGFWNGGGFYNDPHAFTDSTKTLAFMPLNWAGHRHAGFVTGGTPGGPIIADPGSNTNYVYQENQSGKLYGGAVSADGHTVSSVAIRWDDHTVSLGHSSTPPPDWTIPLKMFAVDVTGIPIGQTYF